MFAVNVAKPTAKTETSSARSPSSPTATGTTNSLFAEASSLGAGHAPPLWPDTGASGRRHPALRPSISPSANGIQTKLTVGAANDPLEREADHVADEILAMPAAHPPATSAPPVTRGRDGAVVRRKCACEDSGESCESCKSGTGTIRRLAHSTGPVGAAPPVDAALRETGMPLDPATKSFMEPRFGRDFSNVRLHTGSVANASAAQLNAHAYTVADQIVFARGQFAPNTHTGRRLLAHELTHVVQQSGGQQRLPCASSAVPVTSIVQPMIARQQADPETEKLRSTMSHAAGVASTTMTPEAYQQLKCVINRGGCPQSRDAGTGQEDIPHYNEECKTQDQTGYSGPDIYPTPEQCAELKPGTLDVVSPSRLNEAKSLIVEYAKLVQTGALSVDEMARGDAAIAQAERVLDGLRAPSEPAPKADDAPWVVKGKGGQPVPKPAELSQANAGGALLLFSAAVRLRPIVVSPQALVALAITAGMLCIAYVMNDYLLRKEAAGAIEKLIAALISLFRTLNDAEIERRIREKEKTKEKEKEKEKQPRPTDDPPPPMPDIDQCWASLRLRPRINARWHTQRAPINGNTTVAAAAFRLDAGVPPPTGQDTTDASRRWVRSIGKKTDDAGHVIANRFGGRADFNGPNGNLFPQDLSQNRGGMRMLDAVAAEKHAQGCDVCVHIGLNYDGAAALRPDSVLYTLLYRNPGMRNFNPPIPAVIPNP